MTESVDSKRSFAFFTLPFLFDHTLTAGTSFETLAKQIDAATLKGKNLWTRSECPPADLMPHVGRFLNPTESDDQTGRVPTARMWKLSDGLDDDCGVDRRASWRLSFKNREIPFRFGETGNTKFALHIVLFSIGVGFVTINAAPKSEDLGDWLDFIHAFRFLRGRRGVTVRAEKRTGLDPSTRQPINTPFVPTGVHASGADGSFDFMQLLEALLRASVSAEAPWWRPVFVPDCTLPYVSLFLNGGEDGEHALTLYRVRNFFHGAQEIHPSDEELRFDHPMNMAYTGNQWFMFSLNGGAYAAFPPHDTTFFQETMPDHLRNTYFVAFVLVLHQRFALAMLSESVVQHGLVGADEVQETAFERIRDSLLHFTARGYFAQALQSDHHHRYYRKWQDVFQIPQLYEEVRNEVRDMHDRISMRLSKQEDAREKREEKREKQVEKRLSLLGLLFAVPALILSVFGINIRGFTSGADGLSLYVVIGGLVGGFVLAAVAYWFLLKFRNREDAST